MILVLSLSLFFHQVFHVSCGDRRSFFMFYTPGPPLSMPPSLQPAQAVITDPTRKVGTLVRLLCISLMYCDLIVKRTGHFRVKCTWSSGTDRLLVPVTVARELATDPGIADHAASVLE